MTAFVSKLGLGTVQFGLDYGLSNSSGQVSVNEVARILELAKQSNIHVIDTAAAYGNSEHVLGSLPEVSTHFKLVTKTLPLHAEQIGDTEVQLAGQRFQESLKNLNCTNLYGVLVHSPQDLLNPGGDKLFSLVEAWKRRGLVKKIGVSAYTENEIETLVSRYDIDLVQIPINVFDQRLYSSGLLKQLEQQGIEVHARSVFLQGLLLMSPSDIPDYFQPIKSHMLRYHEYLASINISPLAAALCFVNKLKEVSVMVVGVQSAENLRECVENLGVKEDIDFQDFSLSDERYIDPRNWDN